MGFLVNELKMSSSTSGFKGIPIQLSKHFGNAGLAAEVIGNKSYSTSLDLFSGVYV